jgi:hypothetical protein
VVGGIYGPNHQTSRLVGLSAAWCTGQSVHTGHVRCASHVTKAVGFRPLELCLLGPPGCPVNYSGAPLDFPEGEEFIVKSPGAPDTVRWHTGQSGAPDQGILRLSIALFVEPNSWSFYWLSVNLWHLYNLCTRAKLVSPIVCVGQFNHQNHLGNRCKPNSLSGGFVALFCKGTGLSRFCRGP